MKGLAIFVTLVSGGEFCFPLLQTRRRENEELDMFCKNAESETEQEKQAEHELKLPKQ